MSNDTVQGIEGMCGTSTVEEKMTSVRQDMTDYWSRYSSEPTLENMMLSKNAEEIADSDEVEVLKLAPDVKGLRVLELGAGIGRFTRRLASKALHVTAVDFVAGFIEENRRQNQHLGNVEFLQMDVTKLKCDSAAYDIIFSNWLLMYLNDKEVNELVGNMLKWLKPNGHLLIRESCIRQAGSKPRPTNPTIYRDPATYCSLIQTPAMETQWPQDFHFNLRYATSVQVWIKASGNPFQFAYVFVKAPSSEHFSSFQSFLDERQYSKKNIHLYEMMYGECFVSTGGRATTEALCCQLRLSEGEQVLDIGTGPGGSAIHLAQRYKVHVTAVDLSANMISIASQRQALLSSPTRELIRLEICDIAQRDFPAASFDAIHSRETLVHIANKRALIDKMYRWLRPGGRLLITDYCQGLGTPGNEFLHYKTIRAYNMMTLQSYRTAVQEAGFIEVVVEDRTTEFVKILGDELERFQSQKAPLCQELSKNDLDDVAAGWELKKRRALEGHQIWAHITAVKPAETPTQI